MLSVSPERAIAQVLTARSLLTGSSDPWLSLVGMLGVMVGGGGSFHRAGGATGLRGGRMMVPALLEYTRGGEQASKLEVNRQREVKSYLGRGHAGCRGAPHGDAPGAAGCLHLELRRETGRGTEGEGERCWWTSHGSRCRMRRALPGRRGPAETVPVRTPDTSFPFCVVFHGAFQP